MGIEDDIREIKTSLIVLHNKIDNMKKEAKVKGCVYIKKVNRTQY